MCSSIEADAILDSLERLPVETDVFPTHFDVSVRMKQLISSPMSSQVLLEKAVKRDPIVSLKIMQHANKDLLRPNRLQSITDAIKHIGYDKAKKIALETTLKQLEQSKQMLAICKLNRLIWLHSLYCACAAYVIADNVTDFDPEEAYLAGLSLNIGAFYLLYKASKIQILRENMDDVVYAIEMNYLKRTKELLPGFEMTNRTVQAVCIDLVSCDVCDQEANSLTEVICGANQLASSRYPWVTYHDDDVKEEECEFKLYLPEIEVMFQDIKSYSV